MNRNRHLLMPILYALVFATPCATAGHLIDIDPMSLPPGVEYFQVSAMIGYLPQAQDAIVSGPSGFPPMYHAYFGCGDGEIMVPVPVHSFILGFECGGEWLTYTADAPMWTMMCGGTPEYPPDSPTDFGTDPGLDCLGNAYVVTDLRLTVVGPVLHLEWTHIWGYEGYRVYRLETPWQPLQEGELLSEQWDNQLELPLDGSTRSSFFRVVTLYGD